MKFLFTCILLLFACYIKAADIVFIVYHASGKVNKTGSRAVLKKGDKILAAESVQLGERSSVVLVCSNYKAIQLNKAGSYKVNALLQQCNNSGGSYTGNYFKYVWNEFTHKHGKPESDPGDYMTNIGAASRGCNTVQLGMALDTLYYHNGFLPVHWKAVWDTSLAAIYDMPVDGAPLQKIILKKDQVLELQKLVAGLGPGEYYWQMMDKEGNACERAYLKILDEVSYQQEIERLTAMALQSTKAETAFAKGFILQEHHFAAAALHYYRLAAKLAPKNITYQKAVSQFYATDF